MRLLPIVPLVLLVGCSSRERQLEAAIHEALADYAGSPDRYELGRCDLALLTGDEKQRFQIDYPFESKPPEGATCEVTFRFANFPTAGTSEPVHGRLRFVWLHNGNRWVQR